MSIVATCAADSIHEYLRVVVDILIVFGYGLVVYAVKDLVHVLEDEVLVVISETLGYLPPHCRILFFDKFDKWILYEAGCSHC